MLPVPVAADGQLVTVLGREPKAGLHGAADAEIERQPQDVGTERGGHLGGAVDRAVGDDDDVEARVEGTELFEHATDVALFVVGRHDRDSPEVGELRQPRPRR